MSTSYVSPAGLSICGGLISPGVLSTLITSDVCKFFENKDVKLEMGKLQKVSI